MDGNDTSIKGTDTMEPIAFENIPLTSDITHGSMVRDHRPLKKEKHRCQLDVGGDRLTYDNETAAPVANLLEAKLILNSIISTRNAKFLTVDIKDFFLSSKMKKPEFIQRNVRLETSRHPGV